jgi:hypothetical protein
LVINIKIIKIFYHLFYITMLKDLQKTLKAHHVLLLLGGLVLIYVIYNYSSDKNFYPENYESVNRRNSQQHSSGSQGSSSSGNAPSGANDSTFYVDYAPLNPNDGNTTGIGMPANCNSQNMNTPADLLPSDNNSGWGLKPMGTGDFMGVNFLNAGYLIGVDTIGSSLRNSNQQVRSEPPNPQIIVSPWHNTTIEPDVFRQPLEVGCGPQ